MGDRLPRRRTDAIEDLVAWVLLAAGLLGVLAAVLVGWGVGTHTQDRGRAEAATRTRVDAVLLEDVPVLIGEASGSRQAYVTARWVAPDGSARTGNVPAGAGTAAGSTVAIWTDRRGSAVAASTGPIDAVFLGVACGLGVLVASGAVLGLLWVAARRVIGVGNAASWEREWERVGPKWNRHLR